MKYEIDIEGLKTYLQGLKETDFQNADGRRGTNPNGIIKRAETIDEIEGFKLDKSKITFDTVILYKMPFLCDVLGNDLSIVELSRKENKIPNGRKVKCKFVANVIHDCHKIYGTALNGYWVIPSEFVKYKF